VVSLTPGHYPDWSHRPIEQFTECQVPEVGTMKLLHGQAMIAGQQRTVIVLDSPTLRDGQMRGLQQQLGPVMSGLSRLRQSLKEATRRRREPAIQRQIGRILAHVPQVRQVLRTELIRRADREGFWELDWWVDPEALAHLRDRVFGRRMLATDRQDWPAEQVVWAYWGQAEAELVFRQMKDPEFLALRPQYHWTDQKIQVHSFLLRTGLPAGGAAAPGGAGDGLHGGFAPTAGDAHRNPSGAANRIGRPRGPTSGPLAVGGRRPVDPSTLPQPGGTQRRKPFDTWLCYNSSFVKMLK